ncbi:MAG TPA: sigma 54-interacting transcriptional regulator [Edaphobacter sp.]
MLTLAHSHSVAQPAPPCLTTTERETNQFEMVGESTAMRRLRLQIRRLGPHFRTVLVRGEVGTGKELAARALHQSSPGTDKPFVVCQAGALAEWADSEIHEQIKKAENGTLFLDSIEEMPLRSQARLAKALEQKSCTRMIASSSHDLRILTGSGRFRSDLYHRVATVEIVLDPLRDRMEDLSDLAIHFVTRFGKLHLKRVNTLTEGTMERLREHNWPGNVRELENVLWNAVARCEDTTLEAGHLTSMGAMKSGARSALGTCRSMRLQDVLEQHVLHVLESCAGNKLRAAELLGISRSTLYRMIDSTGQTPAARYTGT